MSNERPSRRRATPRQLRVLSDPARIKGYLHPVRMAVLEMLGGERRTLTSVAREMRVHPANIAHHFRLLQRLGLIRLVETRDTGRNLEKYYAAVARNFVVRPKATRATSKRALALSILRDNLSAAIERITRRSDEALALLASARLGPRDLGRFAKRLQALVAEFQRAEATKGRSYSLNVSLYPDDANASGPKGVRVVIR
jgi:DNA-binding transcriptional ArsR family regulator